MKILTQDKLTIMNVFAHDISIFRDLRPVGDCKRVLPEEYVSIMAVDPLGEYKTKLLGSYPYKVAKEIMLEIAISMVKEDIEVYCMPEDEMVSSTEKAGEELDMLIDKLNEQLSELMKMTENMENNGEKGKSYQDKNVPFGCFVVNPHSHCKEDEDKIAALLSAIFAPGAH